MSRPPELRSILEDPVPLRTGETMSEVLWARAVLNGLRVAMTRRRAREAGRKPRSGGAVAEAMAIAAV